MTLVYQIFRLTMFGAASLLFVAVVSADEAKPVTDSAAGTAPPPTDSVSAETANAAVRTYVGLEIYPKELTLSSIRDSRRVLVTGITADGQKIDVSTKATVTTLSPVCRIDADGYVVPLTSGEGSMSSTLTFWVSGRICLIRDAVTRCEMRF